MERTMRTRLRAGDPAAFSELFGEHAQTIYRYAARTTGDRTAAEDVVSLAFLEAWRLRGRLKPDGGGVGPWLFGIAANVMRNTARAARRHRAAMSRMPVRDPAEEAERIAAAVTVLLEQLYTWQGDGDPFRAFDQIQGLMSERIVPPATRAALYRATALIPGVRLVARSADAMNRQGIAVAFDADGERTEWIFDADSLTFLGTRDYLIADSSRGRAGTLMSSSAVMSQTVTDQAG
ncbi:sigma factor [Streptosporangium jomthongense]|uniref:Sigma factor n=1 Tax=Streptosporangium jomthongense TaxID=1193683 RepID=A0ABV8EXA7_9ACTN